MLMYHHMPIHYDTLQHSNVPHKHIYIKAERRGRGRLHYLADAPPPRPSTLTGEGPGSTDSVLIVDNYIIVWFNL